MATDRIARARRTKTGALVRLGTDGRARRIKPKIDWAKFDATSEADIARHARADNASAKRDAGANLRRMRENAGLSQAAFAAAIRVPVDTLRNWEQGRRAPHGPALALLRVLAAAPKAAFKALAAE